MLEQIPLWDVAQTLDLWWQDSTPKEAVAGRLTPDAIIDRARRAGFGVDIAPIRSWEDRTDEDLLAELLRRTGPLSGELLLVTEASFQASVGGFRLDASVLGSALKEHQERFEPVFNGDVILLSLEDRRIVCVHHENYLVRITPPTSRLPG